MTHIRRSLVAAMLFGCGGSDSSAVDAAAPDAACSLLGSYALEARNDAGFRNGVTFRQDGFFVITRSVGAQVTGTYALNSTTVTFTDQIGEPPSLTCPMNGTYDYHLSADCRTLTFNPISDTCLARTSILQNTTFTRD